MIKLNLLPIKEDKYKNIGQTFFIISIAAMMIFVVTIIGHLSYLSKLEKERKDSLAKLEVHIVEMKRNIKKINELKKKKKGLEEKIEMIVRLQNENIGPVKVLDEISMKIPSNKIWINSLSLQKSKLNFQGRTLENKEVADFMKRLEKSSFFSNVQLRKIQKERVVNNIPTLKYALVSNVYLTGKKKQPKPAAKKSKNEKKRVNRRK